MHELAIIQSVLDIILDEMPRHGLSSISRITLRIGAMRQVIPDSLQFAFECIRPGTPLEHAVLEIDHVPVRGRCKVCQHESNIEHWLNACPECGNNSMEIISGKELEIREFEGD